MIERIEKISTSAKSALSTSQPVCRHIAMTLLLFASSFCPADETVVGDSEKQPATPHTLHDITALYSRGAIDFRGISQIEMDLLQQFAEANSITIEWKEIDDEWNLMPSLLQGKGDLIVGQSSDLIAGMSNELQQSLPWTSAAPVLVVRKDTTHIQSIEDLYSRQVAIKESSQLWNHFEQLADDNFTMSLVTIPETLTEREVLEKIDSGEYDVSIIDSLSFQNEISEFPNLSASLKLSKPRQLVWMTDPANELLGKKLNQFLATSAIKQQRTIVDDLPDMKSRNVLRLITYQSPVNLYFKTGRLLGFEYDLIQRFADKHRMKVNLILASSHTEMQQMLANGEGDVIAASMPVDAIHNEQFIATEPYLHAAPVIVGRDSDEAIIDITDLEGRRITLPLESPYRDYLRDIRQKQGIEFEIVDAEKNMNTEATLYMVAHGMYDLTVIPGHMVKSELAQIEELQVHFALGAPEPMSWFVRQDDRKLFDSLNDYISTSYRSDEYWTLHRKYIAKPRSIKNDSRMISVINQLSPYDELIKSAADEFNFDWRLIAAQMYQESQFDPNALSAAGAEGLMQIMPATAEDLGLYESTDPEQSIFAGVQYMSQLRSSFGNELLPSERSWFSLAAYNAGLGRITRAQKHAESMGLDPTIWFGNVETALRDMTQASVCRCGQTIMYVREIRSLYNNYVNLLEASRLITSRPDSSINHDS